MPKVFINFRGRDQAGFAALLDRELSDNFGADAVFLSSRSIKPGEDFVSAILTNLRRCDVLLAVIGPDWLAHSGAEAARSGQPEPKVDWVRREIAEALREGIRVIPVLVENAVLPREAELPEEISALARCQYLRLHHRNVEHDVARIVEEVARLLPDRPPAVDPAAEAGPAETTLFQLAKPYDSACRIGVVAGTIRRVQDADIWVNSENTDMEMSRPIEFSISGVIRYWGAERDEAGHIVTDVIATELASRVNGRRPVAPGAVVVTGPGELAGTNNVRHVIHVAAVQGEPGMGFRQVLDVGGCVTQALVEADRLALADQNVRSILFPLLGTGSGRAEARPTAAALTDAAIDYLIANPGTGLQTIYFLGYTNEGVATLTDVLDASHRVEPVRDW